MICKFEKVSYTFDLDHDKIYKILQAFRATYFRYPGALRSENADDNDPPYI